MGLVLLTALAVAAPASASTVTTDGVQGFSFQGAPGEANRVTLSYTGGIATGRFDIADAGAPLAAGAGCTSTGEHSATCDYDTFFLCNSGALECSAPRVRVDLGDGDDQALVQHIGSVNAGPGNDLVQAEGVESVYLAGGPGDDTLIGGDGPDRFFGGEGADLMKGRGGSDTTDYSGRAARVTVTIDDKADDGEAGEGDSVQTENVVGGENSDTLIGNAADNGLTGGPGTDTIDGRAGNDRIEGIGAGDQNPDKIRCGSGSDQTYNVPVAATPADCESSFSAAFARPDIELKATRTLKPHRRRVKVKLRNATTVGPASGTVSLVIGGRQVGSGSYSGLASAAPDTVSVRLGSSCRKRPRARPATVVVTAIDATDSQYQTILRRRVLLRC